jgi:hypothetical protein
MRAESGLRSRVRVDEVTHMRKYTSCARRYPRSSSCASQAASCGPNARRLCSRPLIVQRPSLDAPRGARDRCRDTADTVYHSRFDKQPKRKTEIPTHLSKIPHPRLHPRPLLLPHVVLGPPLLALDPLPLLLTISSHPYPSVPVFFCTFLLLAFPIPIFVIWS